MTYFCSLLRSSRRVAHTEAFLLGTWLWFLSISVLLSAHVSNAEPTPTADLRATEASWYQALLRDLAGEDEARRAAARQYLAHAPVEAVLGSVLALLDNDQEPVWHAAQNVARELCARAGAPGQEQSRAYALRQVRGFLAATSSKKVAKRVLVLFAPLQPNYKDLKEIEQLLFCQDPDLREAARAALVEIGNPGAAKALATAARKTHDAEFRVALLHGLSHIGGNKELQTARAFLRDSHAAVRAAAAQTLARLGNPHDARRIEGIVARADDTTRYDAWYALVLYAENLPNDEAYDMYNKVLGGCPIPSLRGSAWTALFRLAASDEPRFDFLLRHLLDEKDAKAFEGLLAAAMEGRLNENAWREIGQYTSRFADDQRILLGLAELRYAPLNTTLFTADLVEAIQNDPSFARNVADGLAECPWIEATQILAQAVKTQAHLDSTETCLPTLARSLVNQAHRVWVHSPEEDTTHEKLAAAVIGTYSEVPMPSVRDELHTWLMLHPTRCGGIFLAREQSRPLDTLPVSVLKRYFEVLTEKPSSARAYDAEHVPEEQECMVAAERFWHALLSTSDLARNIQSAVETAARVSDPATRRRLLASLGFIMDWTLSYPISPASPPFLTQDEVKPWLEDSLHAKNSVVCEAAADIPINLLGVLGETENKVALAVCTLVVENEREVVLHIGSDDGVRVRLNGEILWTKEGPRPLTLDEDTVHARLKRGSNQLVLEVQQLGGGWGFCVRCTNSDGTPCSIPAQREP